VIEHVPVLTSDTTSPDTGHTPFVFDVKVTSSPEVAVALMVKGAVLNA
jgi:hypothetical protein